MNEKVGKFIKELREKKGMSQTELASLMYVSRQAISQWENGVHLPDVDKLTPLAKILGVQLAELLEGEFIQDQKKQNDVLVDEIQTKQKQKKKIIKTFTTVVVILVLILLAFLVYYFINSYKSLKIYSVSYEDDNLGVYGVIVLSRTETYYNIGTSRVNVKNMELYVKENDTESSIVKKEEAMITTRNNIGYSYIKYDNIDELKNNIYLKITTSDNKEYNIQLFVYKFSENSNLLFFNKEEINNEKNQNMTNIEVPEKIKNEFKLEGDTYTLTKKLGNKTITINYHMFTKVFEVIEEYESYYDSWSYSITKSLIKYKKRSNEKTIDSFEANSINDSNIEYFKNTYYDVYFEK